MNAPLRIFLPPFGSILIADGATWGWAKLRKFVPMNELGTKLVTLICALFWGTALMAQEASILGVAQDEYGPVPMLLVELEGDTTLRASTDIDGKFAFAGLSKGSYQLTIRSDIFKSDTLQIKLKDKQKKTIALALKPLAQELDITDVPVDLDDYRSKTVTGAQVVLDEKEVQEQTAVSNHLGDVLEAKVPSMAPSTQSASTFGQGLRGRDMAVFIDGVPQSTPLRGSGRVLRCVEPSNLAELRVLRGASAIYGNGATGGVVEFVTKTPKKEGVQYQGLYNVNLFPLGGASGIGYRSSQQLSGKRKKLAYIANLGYEKTGLYYDGEGDPIPVDPAGQGGTAENNVYNGFFKLNYALNKDAYLEAKYVFYQATQDSDLKTLPGVVGETKAEPYVDDVVGERPPGNINHNASLRYRHYQLFKKTDFSAILFYQDFKARYNYSNFFGSQSYVHSLKFGGRFDFKTVFNPTFKLRYGLDVLTDRTSQELEDGRIWMPRIQQYGMAPFLQLNKDLGEKWNVKAGFRMELVELSIPTFFGVQSVDTVQGGVLSYQAPLFNASLRYRWKSWLTPTLSFSQGFSVADIGRAVRGLSAPSVDALDLKPMVVNNYELGFDGQLKKAKYHVSAYLSTSALGNSYAGWPDVVVLRAPERIYGIELELATPLYKKLSLSTTYSWLEGKVDLDDNDSYESYLNGTRIPPMKLTAQLKYKFSDDFSVFLQGLYVGSRDRFPDSKAVYEGKVDSYFTLDASATRTLWKGSMTLAVKNLLNQAYYPASSQFFNDGGAYVMGQSMHVSATYVLNLATK